MSLIFATESFTHQTDLIMEYNEKICNCTLNRIFGYEPRKALELISAAGSACTVFSLSGDELLGLMGPYSAYSAKICREELDRTAAELERLEKRGCRYLEISDPRFPEMLKECEDPPLGLYIRSDSPVEAVFDSSPYIAVVGTRDISLYGREWCRKVVAALAKAKHKPVIVSGLALGTDIAAHQAALEGGLRTIGVLPTGIDDVYPRRHEYAADQICRTAGCALVTDYPPGTQAIAINFLRRNRIIAGLCSATILIESKAQGGGMITARLAASYNREVYALPGRVDDIRSAGCNRLIQKKLAEPITDLGTLTRSLGLGEGSFRRRDSLAEEVSSRYRGSMAPEEIEFMVKIVRLVRSERGVCCEEIAAALKQSFSTVSAYLTMLESDGFICTDLLGRCSINVRIV